MKKIRQHNDIDISVVIKNTEGEILDPSLCKGIQIRVQTNGNETQIAKYDIYEDGHIVFRFNAKDQTQIGVYDIVISATTTDGRVFTTDVCKAFCIVPCTCCTDNEPGEVETETLEVEATIEITSWGYMCDKRVEAIEEKVERLDKRDDKLQEQIDNNHSEITEAFEGLYDDVEKNYSKKSNTIRHITLSPDASANGLSLLLEGEYDDSNQGSHLLGPHNIILPYATESKAGVMSPEDKTAILENKRDIETLGLITAQGFQGVDESIAKVRQETNASIADTNKNLAKIDEEVGIAIQQLQGQIGDNGLAIEGKQDVLVSGQNIKTINGVSVLGEGNIIIEGSGDMGNYSKKSDTLRHITLSSSTTDNALSLLLEGEYDDSVQGSHILGPHNIELLRSGETIKTINGKSILGEGDIVIEGGGLEFTDLGDMSPAEIISKLEDNTTGIFLVRDNTSSVADIRYTIYKTFVPASMYSFLATKLEWKGSTRVNTIGTYGGDKNGHGGFTPLVSEQQGEIKSGETLSVSGDAVYRAIYSVLNTEV